MIIIKDQTLTLDKAISLKDAYIVHLNIFIASLSWTGKIIFYVYIKIVPQNETITCTTKGQSFISTMIRNQIHRGSISFNSLTSFFMLPWNKELSSPAFSINVGSQFQQDAFVGFMSSYRFLWTTKAKSWMRNNNTF